MSITAQAAVAFGDFQFEKWQNVALIATTGLGTIQLELWDSKSKTVPFTDGSANEYGSITLQVGGVGASLPYLAANGSVPYNAATSGVPKPHTEGAEAQGFGGCFRNTGTVPIAFNTAGTDDGSGVNGLAGVGTGRSPSVFGPRILKPGGTIYFGKFFDPVRV